MNDGFDVVQFAEFARARRLTVLIACAVAVVATAAVSLVLPKKYTATASILIGPPAGQDPRGATSISPVYLESLRSFEHVASSDSLFLRSLEHLGLRRKYAARTIESLKRNVLKVSKPVNTRVIEISATLEDPVKAQALAQFIAEQTVILSRSLDTQFSGDVAKEAEAIFAKAESRLKTALKASEDAAKSPGAEGLAAELSSARELKFSVESDLSKERTELADLASQELSRKSDSAGEQPTFIVRQAAAARARIADLEARDRSLQQAISTTGPRLEIVRQREDSVEAELVAARKEFESAREKLADVRAAASFRGERLDVFDPGIVPQRPSSPNVPLNILAALLISAVASISYLAFRFGYERMTSGADERSYSLR
jgi:succinoglycan biosynthesis transport protein ExoP